MNNIREVRERRGLSQTELAQLIGATPSSVSRYEREDSRVNLPLLFDIANALRCKPADLITELDGDLENRPYRLNIRGSGGEVLLLDERLLPKVDVTTMEVLVVDDDSMAPTLSIGDLVVIDTALRRVSGAGIYALGDGEGGVTLKRVVLNPIRRVAAVTNDNPLYGPVGELQPADLDVIGRVIWAGKRL